MDSTQIAIQGYEFPVHPTGVAHAVSLKEIRTDTAYFQWELRVDNVLTDPTSIVFSETNGTWGIRRVDTNAVVVANNTALTKVSTGLYNYAPTDPAANLTYEVAIKVVYDGVVYRFQSITRSKDVTTENLYGIVPKLHPWVPGCSVPIMRQALRFASQQFCKDTNAWTEVIEVNSVTDQTDYTLTPAGDGDISLIIDDTLAEQYVTLDEDRVSEYAFIENDTIRLVTAPDEDDLVLSVPVVLVPLDDTDTFPSWFIIRYSAAIMLGAVLYLKNQSMSAWGDEKGAKLAELYYNREIRKAKKERRNGRTTAGLVIQFESIA
jgi:hypothetical protein